MLTNYDKNLIFGTIKDKVKLAARDALVMETFNHMCHRYELNRIVDDKVEYTHSITDRIISRAIFEEIKDVRFSNISTSS